MNSLKSWFAGRSLRERRLILVMLALLVVVIVWGGIIRPVRDGLASARARHDAAVIRLAEVEARVSAVRRVQRSRGEGLDAPLADAVRLRADAAGLALASLEPDRDGLAIAIATARAGALLGWIAGLEQDGILVDGLSLTANGDGTVAARLTLRERAI